MCIYGATPNCNCLHRSYVGHGAAPIGGNVWYYPNKCFQAEVTPKMVEAGLAVFHKTYLDRDTQLIAVYRAMHEARAATP